jgi:thiol-disulfide isomerase/thioredoxin
MKTPRWFVLPALLLSLAVPALAAEKSAVDFKSLPFAEASALAAKEGKLVFIDFFTTWCAPCKLLDEHVWSDADVGKLVNAKAVPLKLDAEKEGRELAARYHVSAYPTLLLLKPDGTIVDRLLGFRDAKRFIVDFTAAVNGSPSLVRAAKAVAATAGPTITKETVEARYELAKVQAREGNPAGALEHYLWCFDTGMPAVASYSGVRLSFLLSEIERLSATWPDARDALVSRLYHAEENMLLDATNRQAAGDFAALAATLKQHDRMVAVFDMLPPGDRRRAAMGHRLFDRFLELRRYTDALEVMPYARLKSQFESFQQVQSRVPPNPRLQAQMVEANRKLVLNAGLKAIEALAGAGDLAKAREFHEQLLAVDPTPETAREIGERLKRAGHPELVETIAPPPAK